ncbi:uncharacterized protein LOC142576352 isoform X1 [Dermacentor variabilis]|uniref:uncharacterized protein LOC142576352 isoform X1 n=1 Tax=Dermacentor variabilis TaxID=34621 RepID=UPI003F5B1339
MPRQLMASIHWCLVFLAVLAFIQPWSIEPIDCSPLHESKSYHGTTKLPMDEMLAPLAVPCYCLCAMMSEAMLPGRKLEWFYHWVPCEEASAPMCPAKVCSHANHHHRARRFRRSALQDLGRFIQLALPGGDRLLDSLYTATKGAVGLRKAKSID